MGKYCYNFQYDKYHQKARAQSQHSNNQQPQSVFVGDQNSKYNYSTTLQYQGALKETQSVKDYQRNRVNTCSFVKQRGNDVVAVPFYKRPKNSSISQNQQIEDKNILPQAPQTKKMMSTTTEHFQNKPQITAGMQQKPLQTYNPIAQRSRLPVHDFKQYYANRSVLNFGDRQQHDADHKSYKTTYENELGRKHAAYSHKNAQINSYKFKWDHRLRDK